MEINNKQLEALKNMILEWNKKGQRFLLVQAPVKENFYRSIKNASEIDSIFHKLGPYINFNQPPNRHKLNVIDSLDFYNSHHLNQYGVEKFNEIFLKEILEDNLKLFQ